MYNPKFNTLHTWKPVTCVSQLFFHLRQGCELQKETCCQTLLLGPSISFEVFVTNFRWFVLNVLANVEHHDEFKACNDAGCIWKQLCLGVSCAMRLCPSWFWEADTIAARATLL